MYRLQLRHDQTAKTNSSDNSISALIFVKQKWWLNCTDKSCKVFLQIFYSVGVTTDNCSIGQQISPNHGDSQRGSPEVQHGGGEGTGLLSRTQIQQFGLYRRGSLWHGRVSRSIQCCCLRMFSFVRQVQNVRVDLCRSRDYIFARFGIDSK